jgi:hypothetical protein
MIHYTTSTTTVEEFESINELLTTINGRANNEQMKNCKSSKHGGAGFTGTSSYEYACELLKHGDTVLIDKLVQAINMDKSYNEVKQVAKNEYNVYGYQASVPRYLQGLPTSMINKKKVVQKQKVVNLVRSIGFQAHENTDKIIEEAKKAVQIIQLVESRGYRVNLKVIWNTESYKKSAAMMVQLKHSGEKLNIAKLAFPLANPSMLRRIGFKWLEVAQGLQNTGYAGGYGRSILTATEIKYFVPNLDTAYIIPSYVGNVEQLVESWDLK